MRRSSKVFRSIAAVMAVVLCVGSLAVLGGCSDAESINVLIYGQYLEPEAVAMFEDETGIRVNMDECDTPEELYNKAVNGDSSYDLICTSDYIIERFVQEDILLELNADNIPNKANIGETYWNHSKTFDPELKYSVPHFWGTVGVIYNTKIVAEEDTKSWDMFFNEKYSGKIIMANSIRDSFLVALKSLGYSLNTTNKAEIDEAKDLLIKQKPLVKAYQVETEARDSMISGDGAMALVYNGEAYLAIEGDEELGIQGNPDLAFTIPEEGTNLWIDSWVIPKYCANQANAEKFIDFMCRADIAELNFDYIYYSTPNQAFFESLDEDVQNDDDIFPPQDIVDKSEVFKYLGTDLDAYYSDAWKEIKAE